MNIQQPKDAFLRYMFTLMVVLSEENLVLLSKKGALCTLSNNGIIWHYLECGAGVF